MQIARFPTLLLAFAIASPALYSGFVTHTLETRTALIRLLIAVPVAALMLAGLRMLTKGYGAKKDDEKPPPVRAEAVTGEPISRRSTDPAT